jgi:mono/diheme cytochrome c family protein
MRSSWIIGAVAGTVMAASGAAAQDRAAIEAGAEVYKEHCAICHGERMISIGTAFDLRKLGPDDRARFDKAMIEGKGQMPAWEGTLEAEQFEELWAYVRSRSNN